MSTEEVRGNDSQDKPGKPELPSVESQPAFAYLLKHQAQLLPLERANAVQALLNAGYAGRHVATHLTAAGMKMDEATCRRDSLVARLPEEYKQLIRSGLSVTAVLKRAKTDGVLEQLDACSSEPEVSTAIEDVPTAVKLQVFDRETYLRELHSRQEQIGDSLEEQRKRELEYRERILSRQFAGRDGVPLSRQERLQRLHESINNIQESLDDQRRREQEYRARVRARQFGKRTDR